MSTFVNLVTPKALAFVHQTGFQFQSNVEQQMSTFDDIIQQLTFQKILLKNCSTNKQS